MPKLPSLDHTHTWVRLGKRFGTMMYKCNHPSCYKIATKDLILGKKTVCSLCGEEEFTLSQYDLRLAKPRCVNCSETDEAKQKQKLKHLTESLFFNEVEEGQRRD